MTKEDLQAELQAKIKAGIKPSDLKKSKSTPTSRHSFNQENLLDQKQQLVQKDEELTEQQEQISKLKERIKVLVQEKKDLTELAKVSPEVIAVSLQTTGTNTEELEEPDLTKRLELLKKAPCPPQSNFPIKSKTEIEKNVLIIFLLIVLAGTLLFK